MIQSALTVFFEDPFWVGMYERTDGEWYEVCKIIFGAEPKDYEVWDYLLQNWRKLRFSPPVKGGGLTERKSNPKRLQREIRHSLQKAPVGTKAQQALKLQQEQKKTERKAVGRQQREAEKERQYALRKQKQRQKHRGR
ncbi:MAG: YjdF family protein [Firmicutes bacterium]|nr:YjdF family protein [Bacillota bacterium]